MTTRCLLALMTLSALLVAGCTAGGQDPPVSSATPPTSGAGPGVWPSGQPAPPSPSAIPALAEGGVEGTAEARDCSAANAFPPEEAELVWPTLHQVQPERAAPGDPVEIWGTGGFLYWNNECGEFLNESSKDFRLFFDGELAGTITCYAHTCMAELMVPADAPPGTRAISVEGGSSLDIEIGGPQPPPTLQVASFAASPDPVERGGTLTLTWDVPGAASVGITRLSEEGDIFLATEALDLPARGSLTVQVPDEYVESVKYYLGARDAQGVLYKAYVRAGVICRYDEYLAPRCPLTQDQVWAAYQPFEHGHMIWRSDTWEIYVLTVADGTEDGGKYETYEDTWQEGDAIDIPGTPPPGLYAPVRGFGNLYANESEVRERLGWAQAPEAGYTMQIETIPGGSGRYPGRSIYLALPDGRVVNLYPFASTWEILP